MNAPFRGLGYCILATDDLSRAKEKAEQQFETDEIPVYVSRTITGYGAKWVVWHAAGKDGEYVILSKHVFDLREVDPVSEYSVSNVKW